MEVIESFNGEYRFLSNFYPATVYAGRSAIAYPTVEHAFQAMKTDDPNKRLEISRLATPGESRKVGRTLVLRPDWEQVKFSVMEELLRQKFAAGTTLADLLLATGEAKLIEGNTWGDKTWGCVLIEGRWQGQNHLGRMLMGIRDELRGRRA